MSDKRLREAAGTLIHPDMMPEGPPLDDEAGLR